MLAIERFLANAFPDQEFTIKSGKHLFVVIALTLFTIFLFKNFRIPATIGASGNSGNAGMGHASDVAWFELISKEVRIHALDLKNGG